jgi:hypothetical protein
MVSSFSAQQLRHGLAVFWFSAVSPFGVFDRSLRPGLANAFAGIGLDRFDDGKLFRPPFPLSH